GHLVAPEHDLRMPFSGSTLRRDQIIGTVFSKNMRAFDPDRVLLRMDARIDQDFARSNELHLLGIELLQPDGPVTFVTRLLLGRAIVDDPRAPVLIEEQRRVYAVDWKPCRLGPGPCRILRRDHEIAAARNTRVDDVEGAGVEGDVGSVNALPGVELCEVQLRRAIDRVADLRPIHEVAAMDHRDSGKPDEGRIDEVIVAPDTDDARVRIEALQDGVAVLARCRLRQVIVAAIVEPVEARLRRNAGEESEE